ncbi:hypothetical protein RD792_009324 [Penstemon davidsonii]|uniref:Beta-glucosidase n=1 Tax=Penstemon davidsonii TaxID=160366 RepID=A0ABR0D0R6_9LAMI|nr:hypothetical protein RD792_009324 [Penstemon davidsonii]
MDWFSVCQRRFCILGGTAGKCGWFPELQEYEMGYSDFLSVIYFALLACTAADHYTRADFPADFVFGSATSAYQGDVKLMSEIGLEALRFSISWSRLIPNGRGPVNPKGLQYYNNLIDELINHGIQPHVTLYHVDLPQVLEDEYGGWLSRKIVKDFRAYADVCFREFGDRVLYWTTVNEANAVAAAGYEEGLIPPGHFPPFNVSSWNQTYIVGHNILLAHSATANLYKNKYKATQKGYVGFSINAWWSVPHTNTREDIIATQRANDFYIGWLINPLFFGDYPEIVKKNAQTRIPAFTEYESKQVKGSVDFIGVNHYYTVSIMDRPITADIITRDFDADKALWLIYDQGQPAPDEYAVMPSGLYGVLEYLKQTYGNPPIYIQENGQKTRRNGTLMDTSRVEYIHAYIGSMLDAMRNGSNTKGYFVWTFLDCLELLYGYESSFGLYYVDLDDKELKSVRGRRLIKEFRGKLQLACTAADHYTRADFPADFVFGSATSAYQGDVKLMSETGLEALRFSISWSRLIPNGRGPANPKGLQYYNNLIDELINHGIQPHVTLYHIDLPQVLEDEYGGWLSRKIVKDFRAYADVCFREFGDRVLYWTTVNEANAVAAAGYEDGLIPPGHFPPFNVDSWNQTYIVGHNILLAHSATAKLYKNKYKATQKGYVGFSINAWWLVPHTNTREDIIATQRANDFYIGWLINPLFFGDYPETVKNNAQTRIPAFTKYESKQVKGSVDFIGVNHYCTVSVKNRPITTDITTKGYDADKALWLICQRTRRNGTLMDTSRVEYIHAYIGSMLDAMRNGSNTKGYFVWTFLDCLELLYGYESSFGLYYVDLDDKELKRYQKLSGKWYSNFFKGGNVISEPSKNAPFHLRSGFSQ